MKNAPDSEVTEFLLKIASKEPKKIINLYTGTDTALRLLLIEAKERKVIVVKIKYICIMRNLLELQMMQ